MPPPKKGSDPLFMQILKLPFSLAWRIVFPPADYLMWFIVDKVADNHGGNERGAGALWFTNWIMNKKAKEEAKANPEAFTPKFKMWVQSVAAFTKEFRYVLYDYYAWPRVPSPKWRCKFCSGEGKWWCVECGKKHCPQCAYNQHAPGTSANVHSLEEMVPEWEQSGFHLLTPILPEVLFGILAVYMFFNVELMGPDYLTTQVTCPIVTKVRGFTHALDANLFYYYKTQFFRWCDVEDSFFRFLTDTWVRGIVTRTDNTLLLFQTLPPALLVDVALVYTLVPIASFLYAILAAVIYKFESSLPRKGFPNLEWLEETLWDYNGTFFFGVGSRTDLPPETKERRRDQLDPLEGLQYWKDRKLRAFRYLRQSIQMTLRNAAWQVLVVTFLLRLAMLSTSWLAPMLKNFFSVVGFGGLIKRQEVWYAGAAGVVTEDRIWYVVGNLYTASSSVLGLAPESMHYVVYAWAFGVFLWVLLSTALCTYLVYYRRSFMAGWIMPKEKPGCLEKMKFGQEKTVNWQTKPKVESENGKDGVAEDAPTKTVSSASVLGGVARASSRGSISE